MTFSWIGRLLRQITPKQLIWQEAWKILFVALSNIFKLLPKKVNCTAVSISSASKKDNISIDQL